MDEELLVEKQNFAIIKEKIIKTDELLLLFAKKNEKLGNATVAFKHLKSKHENVMQEVDRLKLDNERLTDILSRLKPVHEQTTTELNNLKVDYTKLEERYQQHLIQSQLHTTELEEKVKQCTCEKNLLTISPTRKKSADDKIRELKLMCSELQEEGHKLQVQNNSLIRKNKTLEEKINHRNNLQKKIDGLQVELHSAKENHSLLQNTIESLQQKHITEVDSLTKKLCTLSSQKEELLPLKAECKALKDQISEMKNRHMNKCDFSTQTSTQIQLEICTQTDPETSIKQDFWTQTEQDISIESTSRKKCHIFTQTENVSIANVVPVKQVEDSLPVNVANKTDEIDVDLLDLDQSLSDIFSEMVAPDIISPMSHCSRSAESPSPPPVIQSITTLDNLLLDKAVMSLNTLPNIIITPPTPNVESNSCSSLPFPTLTDVPKVLFMEDEQNQEQIEDTATSAEIGPHLETVDNPNNHEDGFVNTQGHFPESGSAVRDEMALNSHVYVENDSFPAKRCITASDNPNECCLSLNNTSASSENHKSSEPNRDIEDQSVVTDNSSGLQEKMKLVTGEEKCLTGSEQYKAININQITVPSIIKESSEIIEKPGVKIPLNVKEEKFHRRKFWIPFGGNMFVKSKRHRPPKVTKKYKNSSSKPYNKNDTILDALRVLQKNNISFTISNNSLPSSDDTCGYKATSALPELVIQPDSSRNTFSHSLDCLDKKCTENNNFMMLREGSCNQEPDLLGFYSAKPELRVPTVKKPSSDSNIQNLVQQLLHSLKKLTGPKRNKQKKSRNRISEFNSETESELERLFRKSADVLGRNRRLLAAAREQSLESNGQSFVESESEVMADSGLVTATSKDSDSLKSFYSHGMTSPNEQQPGMENKPPGLRIRPESPLRSFKVPMNVISVGKERSKEDNSPDYKKPLCPSIISPLSTSTKSSPGETMNKKDVSTISCLPSAEESPSLCQKISFDCLSNDNAKHKLEQTTSSLNENSVLDIDLSIKTSDLNCTLDDINISQLEESCVDDDQTNTVVSDCVISPCAKSNLKKKNVSESSPVAECSPSKAEGKRRASKRKLNNATQRETRASMTLRSGNHTGTKRSKNDPSVKLRSGRCLTPYNVQQSSSEGHDRAPEKCLASTVIKDEECKAAFSKSLVDVSKSSPINNLLLKKLSKQNFEQFKMKYTLRQRRICRAQSDPLDGLNRKLGNNSIKSEIKLSNDAAESTKLITIDRSVNDDFHHFDDGKPHNNRTITDEIQNLFKGSSGKSVIKKEIVTNSDGPSSQNNLQKSVAVSEAQLFKKNLTNSAPGTDKCSVENRALVPKKSLRARDNVSRNANNKISIIQKIHITNGNLLNGRKSFAPPATTYSRKKQKLEEQASSKNSDILSQVMEDMTRTRLKPPIVASAATPRGIDIPRSRGNQVKKVEEQDPYGDHPKSPDIVEVPDRLPRLIPTEKPTKMPPSKAVVLMDKLLIFASESQVLDEVVREFAFQDVDFMVEVIVTELSRDINDKPDNKFSPSPPMTITQRILLGFLVRLDKSTHPGILDKFLIAAEKIILNHLTCDLRLLEPFTRLYTAICRMRLDINRIRRFTCECFYFRGDFAVPILFTILTMWPNVLPTESETTTYPLGKVIVQLCYLKSCNQPGYNLLPLRDLLNKYYGYPTERWSCDELFQEILVDYIRNPSVRLSDFTLLLFLKNKPAKWVYQKVKENIMPLLQFIPDANPNLKATLLILLGNICASFNKFDEFEWSVINEMDNWFQSLQEVEEDPIVQSSLNLARRRLPKKPKKKKRTVKETTENAEQNNDSSVKQTEFNVADDLWLSDSSLDENDVTDYVNSVDTTKVTDNSVDSCKQSKSSYIFASDNEDSDQSNVEIDLEHGCDRVNSESINLASSHVGVHSTMDESDDNSDIEF